MDSRKDAIWDTAAVFHCNLCNLPSVTPPMLRCSTNQIAVIWLHVSCSFSALR